MESRKSKKISRVDPSYNDFIDNELNKEKIVIFSKSTCAYSNKAKSLLDGLNYPYNAVDLDELGEIGSNVQIRLHERTGLATVPNIFVDGKHLGGCTDLEEFYTWGILEEILYGELELGTKFDFEILIIGGGSSGLAAALSCANYGNRVCVVNYVKPTPHGASWELGGTCINVGCIPKKMIHKAALLGTDLQDAPIYGWTLPAEIEIEHDWTKLIETIQEYIRSLNWKIRKDIIAYGISYINGMASLNSNHSVTVKFDDGNERVITARNIIIAVGGRPRYLEFPGAEECMTSDDIFSLQEPPGRTLIVGGSYVALEIASFLNSLKIDVTVMVRSEILGMLFFDRDMANALETEMTREGVRFMHGCTVIAVSRSSEGMYQVDSMVDETTPYSDQFNTVILAVGRIPSTQGLEIENAGIKLCSNLKVPVNDMDQTIAKNIFAVGDCAYGRPELSSSAIAAGKLLAKRLNTKDCQCSIDYRCVPTSVFTHPEYACCGASEVAALQLHGEEPIRVYTANVTPLERAVTEPTSKCTAKLVTALDHNKVERLAGCHIIGPNASEIIQGFALALRVGASKKDLDCFIGIHPTCAEIFTNLQLKGDVQAIRC